MGRGFQSGMGGFGGINMNQLMKQAKKMQEEMEKTQEDLASKVFESTAGGGAISVKANGKKQIIEIKLEKEHLEEIEKLKNNILELNKQIFTIKEERDNLKFELTVYRAVEKSENRRTIQGGNDGNRKNR